MRERVRPPLGLKSNSQKNAVKNDVMQALLAEYLDLKDTTFSSYGQDLILQVPVQFSESIWQLLEAERGSISSRWTRLDGI